MKQITHHTPSNWTPREHELVKIVVDRYGAEYGAIRDLGGALAYLEREGATKRCLDSIRSRAANYP